MEYEDKRQIVLDAIKKATGVSFGKDGRTNLLSVFSALDLIYIVKFIEESAGINISKAFDRDPNILTLDGLTSLI